MDVKQIPVAFVCPIELFAQTLSSSVFLPLAFFVLFFWGTVHIKLKRQDFLLPFFALRLKFAYLGS